MGEIRVADETDFIIQPAKDPGTGGPAGTPPPAAGVPPRPVGPPPGPAGPPPGVAGPGAGSGASGLGGLLRALQPKRRAPGSGTASLPQQAGTQPRQDASRSEGTRGLAGLLRHWPLLVAAVVPCLILAGIGWWLWPEQPPVGPPHIAAGTVQADLLSPDSVSRVAGTTLVAGAQSDRPGAALKVSPRACAVAAGPTTQSVYGDGWNAFLSATYRDSAATGSYTVNQVIGVYPDSKDAGAAFSTLTKGLSKCPSSTRTDQAGRTSKWTYKANPATEVAVAWTAAQDAAANWSCAHQARVNGTSLIQVSVCQAGDGQATASKLTDNLAKKVSR
ncbi:sensor domain-containing protein [Streptomyces sp. NPDC048638]|uniref:sensor domain-containing protein n=1 Tax=Streptomyces sp. NPDC048638 TaxID=3365580 RepID=UPI003716453E